VLPYTPIVRLEDNLWTVEGEVPRMPIRRRMTVIRLADGRLVIHSAMALHEEDMAAIEAWGPPSILIVPSDYHRMDAPRFKERYPDLQVFCPGPCAGRVSQVIAPDGHYGGLPDDFTMRCEALDGVKSGEAVFIVRSEERVTLVFNDALFNHPHTPGLKGLVGRLVGSTGGARVTPVMRLFVVSDRRALRAHLHRLSRLDGLHRLVPGHGDVVDEDAAGVLASVADKL
jgi:hypothetical protein